MAAGKVSKKTIFFTGLIILIFAAIFGYKIFVNMMISQFMAHFTFPPNTVSVTQSTDETWHPFLTATGNAVAIEGVNITPQVSGIVTQILFQSGQMVKQGDLLLTLDNKEQQGDLASAKAATVLAEINYKRDLKLLETQAISQSMVDTDLANLEEKQGAQVQAEAQLAYREIRAPFSGKLGIRLANLGQFLNAGDTITNIQTVDPIYVDYYLPEQNISQIQVGQPVEVLVTAYPNDVFKGKIQAIDAKVSLDTHSVLVRAEVQNNDPQHQLTPGMFTTVHTLQPEMDHVVTLPLQAVNYTLYGDSVYLIEHHPAIGTGKTAKPASDTVKLIYVTTGQQMGNKVEILSGLKAGETVVLQGQVKLQDGGAVIVESQPKTIENSYDKRY